VLLPDRLRYLNWNVSELLLPSFNDTMSCLHDPAHALSVFQLNMKWSVL